MTAPRNFTSATDRKVVALRDDHDVDVKVKEITAGIGNAAQAQSEVLASPDGKASAELPSKLLPPVRRRSKRAPEKAPVATNRALSQERTPSYGSRQPPAKNLPRSLAPLAATPVPKEQDEPENSARKETASAKVIARTPPSRLPPPQCKVESARRVVKEKPTRGMPDSGRRECLRSPERKRREVAKTTKCVGKKKTTSVFEEAMDMQKLNKKLKIIEFDYKHYEKVIRRASPRYRESILRRLDEAKDALKEEEMRARKLHTMTQTLNNKDQRVNSLSPSREAAEIHRLEKQSDHLERKIAKCTEKKIETDKKTKEAQDKTEVVNASLAETAGVQQQEMADRRAIEKRLDTERRTREQKMTEEIEELMSKRQMLQHRFTQSIQSQQLVLQGLDETLKACTEKQKRLCTQLEQWRKRKGAEVHDLLGDIPIRASSPSPPRSPSPKKRDVMSPTTPARSILGGSPKRPACVECPPKAGEEIFPDPPKNGNLHWNLVRDDDENEGSIADETRGGEGTVPVSPCAEQEETGMSVQEDDDANAVPGTPLAEEIEESGILPEAAGTVPASPQAEEVGEMDIPMMDEEAVGTVPVTPLAEEVGETGISMMDEEVVGTVPVTPLAEEVGEMAMMDEEVGTVPVTPLADDVGETGISMMDEEVGTVPVTPLAEDIGETADPLNGGEDAGTVPVKPLAGDVGDQSAKVDKEETAEEPAAPLAKEMDDNAASAPLDVEAKVSDLGKDCVELPVAEIFGDSGSSVDDDFESCTQSAMSAALNAIMQGEAAAPFAADAENEEESEEEYSGDFQAEESMSPVSPTLDKEDFAADVPIDAEVKAAEAKAADAEASDAIESNAGAVPTKDNNVVPKLGMEHAHNDFDALLSGKRSGAADNQSEGVLTSRTNNDGASGITPQAKHGRRAKPSTEAREDDFDALLTGKRSGATDNQSEGMLTSRTNNDGGSGITPKAKQGRRRPQEASVKKGDDDDFDTFLSKK